MKDNLNKNAITKLVVPLSTGLVFIKINEIIYFEADGSYCNIYLNDGSKIVVSKNLKHFQNLLEFNKNFIRVHRSNFINVDTVTMFDRNNSELKLEQNHIVKVSKSYKYELLEKLNLHNKY